MNKNQIHYEKFNLKHKYRLNAYDNLSEKHAYYVLTKGKYRIEYASLSFYTMYKYIKEHHIALHNIHLNNLTLDDLFCYMEFPDEEKL